jgi:SAM-dependent methyltransferase
MTTMISFAAEEARIRDAYARRRSLHARESFFNPGHLYLLQERERHVLRLLRSLHLTDLGGARILDVGCGTGQWLCNFVKWGARPEHLMGVDLLPERVADARRSCPPAVTIECASAAHLPVKDGSFDIVLQSMVFTSVLDRALQQQIAAEMLRALAPHGVIIWYDFFRDNPRNPDVRGVTAADIRRLFPTCRIRLQRTTLLPPLARQLARVSTRLCDLLALPPLLRTHYLGTITPLTHAPIASVDRAITHRDGASTMSITTMADHAVTHPMEQAR